MKSGWWVEPRSQRALSVVHHPCFRNKQSNKDKTRFILLLTRRNKKKKDTYATLRFSLLFRHLPRMFCSISFCLPWKRKNIPRKINHNDKQLSVGPVGPLNTSIYNNPLLSPLKIGDASVREVHKGSVRVVERKCLDSDPSQTAHTLASFIGSNLTGFAARAPVLMRVCKLAKWTLTFPFPTSRMGWQSASSRPRTQRLERPCHKIWRLVGSLLISLLESCKLEMHASI